MKVRRKLTNGKVKSELIGKVVSASCDKTITIEVVTYKKHPLYNKNVKTTKNMQYMMKRIKLK